MRDEKLKQELSEKVLEAVQNFRGLSLDEKLEMLYIYAITQNTSDLDLKREVFKTCNDSLTKPSKAVDEIKRHIDSMGENGAYSPMLHVDITGYGELTAVHYYGDAESPVVWKGPLTIEEIIQLRDAELISESCSVTRIIKR